MLSIISIKKVYIFIIETSEMRRWWSVRDVAGFIRPIRLVEQVMMI